MKPQQYKEIAKHCKEASVSLTRAWNCLNHFELSTKDRQLAQRLDEAQGAVLRAKMMVLPMISLQDPVGKKEEGGAKDKS